jgi:hypothetical protein
MLFTSRYPVACNLRLFFADVLALARMYGCILTIYSIIWKRPSGRVSFLAIFQSDTLSSLMHLGMWEISLKRLLRPSTLRRALGWRHGRYSRLHGWR